MYDGVFQRHPDVIPIEEVDTLGFEAVVLHCIEEILTVVGSDGFICFCVDDLIFIDKVDLRYVGSSSCVENFLLSPRILRLSAHCSCLLLLRSYYAHALAAESE